MQRNRLKRCILVLLLVLSGCTKIPTVGLKSQKMGITPYKIIWIQVAGLQEEHLAMLRFSDLLANNKTFIESATCLGKMWNYNLFNLRPGSKNSFLSQITGSKNIKNSCEDYKQEPIWKYLGKLGYKAGIFETGESKTNLYDDCMICPKDGKDFLKNVWFWAMRAPKSNLDSVYHYQERKDLGMPQLYYDKSCVNASCYSSISNNVKSIYSRFAKNSRRHLFIIQDHKYLKALNNKNIIEAKKVLVEIEQVVKFFLEKANLSNQMLLLISSSNVKNIEFPKKGRPWIDFATKGKNILYKRSSLMSSVFATGARAENFCGIFEESEIFQRILVSPKQKSKRDILLNIFK